MSHNRKYIGVNKTTLEWMEHVSEVMLKERTSMTLQETVERVGWGTYRTVPNRDPQPLYVGLMLQDALVALREVEAAYLSATGKEYSQRDAFTGLNGSVCRESIEEYWRITKEIHREFLSKSTS